jgi:serine/threonine protein kinase
MSPEIMTNTIKQETSSKTDVYSFGIIMYEMFFEKAPYADDEFETMIGLSSQVINGLRPLVPFGVYDVVTIEERSYLDLMHDCWNAKPEDRPSFDRIYSVFMDILNGV